MNGCMPVHPECRYVKGKEEGERKGALRRNTKFFYLMLGIFTLSAISEDSAKEEAGFN